MRSMFRSVFLALAALLALSAVATASASAHEWLLNGKPVTESTPVTFALQSGTTFTLTDKTIAVGGEPTLSCTAVTGKGTVAPGGLGTITEFKLAKCSKTKNGGGCEEETKKTEEGKEWVKAVHLPWKTSFANPEKLKMTGTSGFPGWQFECTFIWTKEIEKDTCTEATLSQVSNGIEGGVKDEIPFAPPFERYACRTTIGKTEGEVRLNAAEVNVHIILKGPEGKTLSFN
jgi:hypothetical protein